MTEMFLIIFTTLINYLISVLYFSNPDPEQLFIIEFKYLTVWARWPEQKPSLASPFGRLRTGVIRQLNQQSSSDIVERWAQPELQTNKTKIKLNLPGYPREAEGMRARPRVLSPVPPGAVTATAPPACSAWSRETNSSFSGNILTPHQGERKERGKDNLSLSLCWWIVSPGRLHYYKLSVLRVENVEANCSDEKVKYPFNWCSVSCLKDGYFTIRLAWKNGYFAIHLAWGMGHGTTKTPLSTVYGVYSQWMSDSDF